MTLYETTFVLDSQMKEDGWEEAVAKYSGIIEQNGTVKDTYLWGVRRLAYEIRKQTHGYYVHIIHESAPTTPRELERQFQLDENCLRHLTVLADNPLYLDEMAKQRARQTESESGSSESGSSETSSKREESAPKSASGEDKEPKKTDEAENKPAASTTEDAKETS